MQDVQRWDLKRACGPTAHILLGAHINDFVIACAYRQEHDAFRARLLDAFEGT